MTASLRSKRQEKQKQNQMLKAGFSSFILSVLYCFIELFPQVLTATTEQMF